MLCVETKVAPSKIHGLGLFAERLIPAGTILWEFTPGFDRTYTKNEILELPLQAQVHLCTYAWKNWEDDMYYHCADNAKYINHSDDPNCQSAVIEGRSVTIARRDINPGEELTDDYNTFEDPNDEDNILDHLTKNAC